jgi:ubiquinone/menaquinone biosynthesis C-methylase UbiE
MNRGWRDEHRRTTASDTAAPRHVFQSHCAAALWGAWQVVVESAVVVWTRAARPERRMDAKTHWQHVYRTKRADEVSWFQREPTVSTELIRRAAPETTARIVDVGGGASTLVDSLLRHGYSELTVLDLSSAALAQARERLGAAGPAVTWQEADVLTVELPAAAFDVWHDRAVFHFLTEPADRSAYVAQVRRALRPGGHLLVATFAEDGPVKCSGLSVARYSAQTLGDEFGTPFRLVESVREQHVTPSGTTQSFVYCLCRFTPPAGTRAA